MDSTIEASLSRPHAGSWINDNLGTHCGFYYWGFGAGSWINDNLGTHCGFYYWGFGLWALVLAVGSVTTLALIVDSGIGASVSGTWCWQLDQ